MRVAIDISSAVKSQPTGVANSILSLVTALSEIDQENCYYLCCRLSRLLKYYKYLPRIRKQNFRTKIIHGSINPFFPRSIDIFHSGGSRIPDYKGPKLIATLHDVDLLETEEFSTKDYREWKLLRYLDSVNRATKIITMSEYSKKEIVRNYQINEEKVEVIYHGVDRVYYPRPTQEINAVTRKYGLCEDYILSVGAGKRKNTTRILEAFKGLVQNMERDIQLALVGRIEKERYFPLIEDLSLRKRIRLLGYVPKEDLPLLYSGARLLCFPSIYEGFGLPVLEAMASGCPVITSNVTALPEVAGDAALIVNPCNVEDILKNLCRCIEDEGLRRDLVKRGLERAKLFSWERAAEKVLHLYKEIC
ncbi:MAG: glycosyltransferase family 4 protein [bacterium]